MGLFNKLLGGRNSDDAPFDAQEGAAGIFLLAIGSDGHISEDEIASFKVVVNRMELFQNQNDGQFSAMIDKLFRIIDRTAPQEFLPRCAQPLSTELRETVFAITADLIFADGNVDDNERQMLEDLREVLKLSEDLALKIVEVILIKNRG